MALKKRPGMDKLFESRAKNVLKLNRGALYWGNVGLEKFGWPDWKAGQAASGPQALSFSMPGQIER